jgi:protein SCO1/2
MKQNRLTASLLALMLALPALADHAPRQAAGHQLDGWALAPFTLTEQNGRDFTQERLQGRWTFVLFGDSSACAQQPCGAALAALVGLSQRIASTDVMKTTQVIFVSLEPQRDTPARLRQYLAGFDTRFIGATGTPATLQQLADDLGAAAAPVGLQGAPRHYSGSLLLIGPDATIRAEYLPPLDMLRLTAAYLRTRHGSR